MNRPVGIAHKLAADENQICPSVSQNAVGLNWICDPADSVRQHPGFFPDTFRQGPPDNPRSREFARPHNASG
jgi:hypothetical protein